MLAMRERQNAFHVDEALMRPCVADENVHVDEVFRRMANTSSHLKDDVDRELEMKKISKDEAVDDEDTKENILQVGELEKVKEATKMAIETLEQI